MLSIIDFADVKATVSAPVSVAPNGAVTVDVGFGNVGSQVAASTGYTLQLAPGLTGVACVGATCSYNSATGAVTVTGLPGSLSPGQWSNLTVSYTAPSSGNVSVTASVSTGTNQGNNLAPDSASAITLVGGGSNDADVMTTVSAPPSSVPGGAVSVPVVFANVGGTTATGVTYGVTLTPGLNPAQVSCTGGATCVYDSGSGALTVTGLSGTLTPGQSVPVTVNYIAPATPVTVASTVNAVGDANAANNTASGTTTPTTNASAPDVVTSISPPATATPGAAVAVPVRFGNLGDAPAVGMTYTLTVPAGLTGVSCAPAVCNYSGTTVTVTAGLPATLNPGGWADMTLRYNAPASGVVTVTSNVSTTTPNDPTANNTATGATTVVTASTGADVRTTVQPPATVAPGATVNVPVTLSNAGPNPAVGVTASVKLPPGLTGVSCSGSVVTFCGYDNITGDVVLTGVPATLTPGESVPFTLTYTAPPTGQVTVEADITTTTPDPKSANNKSTGSTDVVAGAQPDMTTSVAAPASAPGGSTVTVQVHYENTGGSQATGVGYDIDLTGSPTNVVVTYNGGTCSYNAATGAVTPGTVPACQLPATRNPGEVVDLVVAYTAPASGTVDVTTTVTSAADGNPANNTASGSTSFTPAPDMAVNLTGLPTTGTQGVPYTGSYTCTNVGQANATAGTSCAVTGLPTGLTQGACTISPGNTAWVAGNAVPAGQVVTCQVTGTPTTAGGPTTVTGTTGATGDQNTTNNSRTTTITVGTAPDVRVDVSGLPTTATVGVPYNGTYSCSNTGSANAMAATTCAVASLPPGVNPGACTISGGGAWVAGNAIPVGQTVICTVSGLPTTPGTTTATVTTSTTGDADPSNNTLPRSITVAAAGGAGGNPAAIPTLSEWGLIILSGLMGLFMAGAYRRRMR